MEFFVHRMPINKRQIAQGSSSRGDPEKEGYEGSNGRLQLDDGNRIGSTTLLPAKA
jgi:hypothetical protein